MHAHSVRARGTFAMSNVAQFAQLWCTCLVPVECCGGSCRTPRRRKCATLVFVELVTVVSMHKLTSDAHVYLNFTQLLL